MIFKNLFTLSFAVASLLGMATADVEILKLDWAATTSCQKPHQPEEFITSEIWQAVFDGVDAYSRGTTYGPYPRNYGNSDGLRFQFNECKQERFEYPLFSGNPTWAKDHNRQPGAYRVLFSKPFRQGDGKWISTYCGAMVHPVNDLSRFVKCPQNGSNPPLGRRFVLELDTNTTTTNVPETKRNIGRLARHLE